MVDPYILLPNYKNASLASKLTMTLNADTAMVDAKGALNGIRWGFLPFPYMPMIYHGAVSAQVVADIRARSGTFFNSDIPDVYSGLAVAAVTPQYLFLGKPVSMHGASSHSTGIAILDRARNSAMTEESNSSVAKYLAEVKDGGHPDFLSVSEMPAAQTAYTTDCLYQVRDRVLGGMLYVPAWYRLILMMRELRRTTGDFTQKSAPLAAYARKHGLSWLFRTLRRGPPKDGPLFDDQSLARWTPAQQRLVLDMENFGVRDAESASRFAAGFYSGISLPTKLPYINGARLFVGKLASLVVGKIFRIFYPWGGYMR